jgi:hypothetical protein
VVVVRGDGGRQRWVMTTGGEWWGWWYLRAKDCERGFERERKNEIESKSESDSKYLVMNMEGDEILVKLEDGGR